MGAASTITGTIAATRPSSPAMARMRSTSLAGK
jgi:hypothetical protein